MRAVLALFFSVIAGSSINSAQADPYRWCAVYRGSSSCYFMTPEQCRAAVSGFNGFCTPNNFYDGRPVTMPGGPDGSPRIHHPQYVAPTGVRKPPGKPLDDRKGLTPLLEHHEKEIKDHTLKSICKGAPGCEGGHLRK